MNRPAWLLALLVGGYLASGFYLVSGADKAAVRRFGRLTQELRGSGLWWDLPWPFTAIDRVNVSALRTLTIGDAGSPSDPDEILPAVPLRSASVLTGDSNLLNIRASVQFHLREDRVAEYLFQRRVADEELRLLVEAAIAEAAAQSGVDYLQTEGLALLNVRLTERVRREAERWGLGVEIEQVTLDRVDPPTLVQADFLDVANARAEAAQARHEAQTAADQRLTSATAEARRLVAAARTESQAEVAQARGEADRFLQLTDQIAEDARTSGRSYAACRHLTEQRLTADTLAAVLSQVRRQWVFDSREPVILNLQPAK
uniref:Band 7 domain-containing protein n=1 Tax=Schlesneria paludicola TaxID=360056 RepID=A0A7C2JXS5_9PLAN